MFCCKDKNSCGPAGSDGSASDSTIALDGAGGAVGIDAPAVDVGVDLPFGAGGSGGIATATGGSSATDGPKATGGVITTGGMTGTGGIGAGGIDAPAVDSGADAPMATGGMIATGGITGTGGMGVGGSGSGGQVTCSGSTKLCDGACIPSTSCCGGCSGNTPVCSDGTCVGRTPGDLCSTGAECASGFCTDGVCCKSACTDSCVACNSSGNCTRVTGDPRPGHPACTATDATCAGSCSGSADACSYPVADRICTAGGCSADQLSQITARTCNGAGACTSSNTVACAGQTYCSGDACVPRVSSGSCTSSVQCTTTPARTCIDNNSGGKICCASGLIGCSGTCTDPTTNSNCGSCGNMCGVVSTANQTCQSKTCQCENGTVTCDGGGGTSCNSANFESDSLMNWSQSGVYSSWLLTGSDGSPGMQVSSAYAHTGQRSLALTISNSGAIADPAHPWARLRFQMCRAGLTPVSSISFYVRPAAEWVTPGTVAYVGAAADESNVSSTAMMFSPPGYVVNPGAWQQVNLTIPYDAPFNANYVFLQFGAYVEPDANGNTPAYSNTLYIDDVVVH